jgi:ubiquinone/menaquinone biosynthesis C-methylase UbiE
MRYHHGMASSDTWWERSILPWLIEKSCRSTAILAERKRWVAQATGRVLELGVGSGLNLPFYDRANVESITGIDVSRTLLDRAEERKTQASVPVSLQKASAEALPFEDSSFDSVVVTYSLCSIPRVEQALAEVRRTLKTDGKLIFVEHGLSDNPGVARWQHRVSPLWRRAGGGCLLNRNISQLIGQAGFHFETLEKSETDARLRVTAFGYQGIARATPSPWSRS